MLREDGRKFNEERKIKITKNINIYAEGSTKTASATAFQNSAIIFLNSLSALASHFYTFSLFKLSPL